MTPFADHGGRIGIGCFRRVEQLTGLLGDAVPLDFLPLSSGPLFLVRISVLFSFGYRLLLVRTDAFRFGVAGDLNDVLGLLGRVHGRVGRFDGRVGVLRGLLCGVLRLARMGGRVLRRRRRGTSVLRS